MTRIIPQRIKIAVVSVVTIVAFVPLWLNSSDGADFPRYFMWAKAFNQGNIFCLEGDVLSPSGVPLAMFSFGPGLVFSLGSIFSAIRPNDAIFVGWLFIIIFWISYVGILLRATNNNHSLSLFGACITFIGTPIGYYSSAYASESLSYACLSVMVYWVLGRNRFSTFDYLIVGLWAALLVVVRSQLALYVVPVYLVILGKIWEEIKSGGILIQGSALRMVAFHAPVFLAFCASAQANFWMTGSPFASAYSFGAVDFKSVDLLHPELLAVLLHPWHGLFAYHPLYLLGFASLAVIVFRQRCGKQSFIFVVTAVILGMHVYLHASWYAWWLGLATFGMRGLSICGIILVPILIKLISEREEQGKSSSALIFVIFLMNIWSFALLTQGPTQYYTYQQLFSGVSSAIVNLTRLGFIILPLAVFGLGSIITLKYGKSRTSLTFRNLVTAVLLLLVIHYQITPLLYDRTGMLTVSLISLGAMFAMLMGYPVAVEAYQKYSHALEIMVQVLSATGFIVMVVLFVNLMVTTNRILAAKVPVPRTFTRAGTVDIDEIKWSLIEYLKVPGFDDNKARLSAYIDYLDSSSRMR